MMTKELHRPCTLWGETFDAYDARICEINMQGSSSNFEIWVEIWNANGCIVVKQCFSDKEIRIAQMEAITTIAEALNAPMLATEEVLAGLPKNAEALVFTGGYAPIPYNLYWGRHCYSFGKDEVWFFNEFNTNFKNCRIQAKNDPKTLEYLLQFTLDGVRVKEETSHD